MQENNWESKYKNLKDVWGIEAEYTLSQYENLVDSGAILDIGIGEGRNIIQFALKGNRIEGVDISETAIERADKRLSQLKSNYKLNCCDISELKFKDNYYSLVISTWSLNFLKKSELDRTMSKIKKSVKSNGLIYIAMFSKADPMYTKYKKELEEVEKNTFYHPERNSYINYLDKDELLNYFKDDFDIVTIKEDYSMDLGHGDEHYHGALEILARKKL